MSDLLEDLRESRKNPSVLKHALILVRSSRPDSLVFIFEGQEDIGVFETWIRRTVNNPEYEPVAGKGKEQLLALYEKLQEEGSALLRRVYFFVDCDFDPYDPICHHVFVLPAYSIENILCCPSALRSVLEDEFRCAGAPEERDRILQNYSTLLGDFERHASDVNFLLFAARRERIDVLKKPKDSRDLAKIGLTFVEKAYVNLTDIIELGKPLDDAVETRLRAEFDKLPADRRQRGKYLISFTRQWLRQLAEDRKSERPSLFSRAVPNLPGEPWVFALRRLAAHSVLPDGLDEFIARSVDAV